MNKKVIGVKLAYSELNTEERREIRDFIAEYEREDYSSKRSSNEKLRKSLGPIDSATCPVCGK